MCMTKNGLLHAYKLHDTPFDTLFTLQLQNGNIVTQQSAQTKIQLSAQMWWAGFWLLSSALLLHFSIDEWSNTQNWNNLKKMGFRLLSQRIVHISKPEAQVPSTWSVTTFSQSKVMQNRWNVVACQNNILKSEKKTIHLCFNSCST